MQSVRLELIYTSSTLNEIKYLSNPNECKKLSTVRCSTWKRKMIKKKVTDSDHTLEKLSITDDNLTF